jgi:hypothetical protein
VGRFLMDEAPLKAYREILGGCAALDTELTLPRQGILPSAI